MTRHTEFKYEFVHGGAHMKGCPKGRISDVSEDAPNFERTSLSRGIDKMPKDRGSMFTRLLRSYVGRPWNSFYRDLCRNADARSFHGRHLREHAKHLLEPRTKLHEQLFAGGYYFVDPRGFIRYSKDKRLTFTNRRKTS